MKQTQTWGDWVYSFLWTEEEVENKNFDLKKLNKDGCNIVIIGPGNQEIVKNIIEKGLEKDMSDVVMSPHQYYFEKTKNIVLFEKTFNHFKKGFFRDTNVKKLYDSNKVITITLMEHSYPIGAELREKIDYVFILNDDDEKHKKVLFTHWGTGDHKEFIENMNGCLIIDTKNKKQYYL